MHAPGYVIMQCRPIRISDGLKPFILCKANYVRQNVFSQLYSQQESDIEMTH